MYYIIRFLIVTAILGGILPLLLRKIRVRHKGTLLVTCVLSMWILFLALFFIPFENCFVTFSSPQKAYDYYDFGRSDADLVVEGRDCDLVVDQKEEMTNHKMIPKTQKGWKIGAGFTMKSKDPIMLDPVVIRVYEYKKTKDCFIRITDRHGEIFQISDPYGTRFSSLKKQGEQYATYYGHIPSDIPAYSLTVNGQEVTIPLWEEGEEL